MLREEITRVRRSFTPEFKRDAARLVKQGRRSRKWLAIFDYAEAFCNRNRLHSSLDYHSPEAYETLRSAA
jgi:transposase InsO family protein